ncbi:REP-associated tyrosine transposase [Pseudomonas sp. AM4(2022)]|uniref:REP-associated tyrosine transposase n=1 Tax=Pseudomonas sp. AM4(2022) TaxID=2983408 RepID=UPI003FA6D599
MVDVFREQARSYRKPGHIQNQCLDANRRCSLLPFLFHPQEEDDGEATSLAWVVMPDHFHWLVELHNGDLSRLMRITKSRSAHAINKARSCHGALWQKGYFDRALRREDDLKTMARYIVANPLRAGLVEHIGQYPLWDAIWL